MGRIGDESVLPLFSNLLNHEDVNVREGAIRGIAWMQSDVRLPILMAMSTDPKSLITLIKELSRMTYCRSEGQGSISKAFVDHPIWFQEFFTIAEKTLLSLIEIPEPSGRAVFALGRLSKSDRVVSAIGKILKSPECTYDLEDYGVMALACIKTDAAINELLGLLPNQYVLGGWVDMQLGNIGMLDIIPQLWSLQFQEFSWRRPETIERIQQKAGFYSPDFIVSSLDQSDNST